MAELLSKTSPRCEHCWPLLALLHIVHHTFSPFRGRRLQQLTNISNINKSTTKNKSNINVTNRAYLVDISLVVQNPLLQVIPVLPRGVTWLVNQPGNLLMGLVTIAFQPLQLVLPLLMASPITAHLELQPQQVVLGIPVWPARDLRVAADGPPWPGRLKVRPSSTTFQKPISLLPVVYSKRSVHHVRQAAATAYLVSYGHDFPGWYLRNISPLLEESLLPHEGFLF